MNARSIFFASITGFGYLIINFYGNKFLPYVATRIIQETSKVILILFLAIVFLGEQISIYDFLGIGILVI